MTTKNGAIWSQCSAAGEGTGRKGAELSLGENLGCKSYEKKCPGETTLNHGAAESDIEKLANIISVENLGPTRNMFFQKPVPVKSCFFQ